jgi:cytochrome c biogenesis protein CcdA
MSTRPHFVQGARQRFRVVAIIFPVCVALVVAGVSLENTASRLQAQDASGLLNLRDLVAKPVAKKASSSDAKITLEPVSATAGDVVTVNVALDLPAGSHTYSTFEGFSGRTRFEIKTATGVEPVDAEFVASIEPESRIDDLLGDVVETHEGKIVWTRRFRVKAGDSPASVKIAGEMRYQVCDATSCRPKNQKFDLSLAGQPTAPVFEFKYAPTRKIKGVEKPGRSTWTVRLSPSKASPGEKIQLSIHARMIDGYHTFAVDHDRKNIGVPTTIEELAIAGLKPADPKSGFKPSHAAEPHQALGKTQQVHHGEITWTRDYIATESAFGIAGKVLFQICDEDSCVQKKFDFRLGTVDDSPQAKETDTKPASTGSSDSASVFDDLQHREPGGATAEGGLGQFLLFAFLGGLILNVMPCVLPVIAIKVLSFVQQAGEARGRIFLLNATYSLGVISVFMLLATLAVFAGTSWGGLFQSVAFLVAMSALVFVMGLSLLGVFEIPIPGFVGSSAGGHQEGLGGAFMTGIFATILATPCSGPFLGPTLGWSIQQSPATIYMIWGMMGLGMASPYLLFGLFPGAVRFLPKPGSWMIRFKQIAGFIMLGTTVFLLSILKEEYLVPTLVMLLGVGIGVWMIGNLYNLSSPPATRWKVRLAALCMVGVISSYGYHLSSADEKIHWKPFTPAAVAEALKNSQPVMVDFTADW